MINMLIIHEVKVFDQSHSLSMSLHLPTTQPPTHLAVFCVVYFLYACAFLFYLSTNLRLFCLCIDLSCSNNYLLILASSSCVIPLSCLLSCYSGSSLK